MMKAAKLLNFLEFLKLLYLVDKLFKLGNYLKALDL